MNKFEVSQYQKAINYLKAGCKCQCYVNIPIKEFAELRENFQALTKNKKDIYLMSQFQLMKGGNTCQSSRFKNKKRIKLYIFYH
jgi:hypothetical protein